MITSTYIHIPFCEKICYYCDFTKFFYQESMADDYLEALEKELHFYLRYEKHSMRTVYVGGGTPTALNLRQLEYLLKMIEKRIDTPSVYEYTFEANPGDLTEDKIKLLCSYGVNRISMGAQTFDNQLLEDLGRLHRAKDVGINIERLLKHGLKNISIDLMYGLPNQTLDGFADSLEQALAFDLPHYSSYSLQIEPKTIFYQRHQKGKLHKPPEEVEANMFELLIDKMKQNGNVQYEISNFAKHGYESQHNLTYWDNKYYYGFGAGASGYLPGRRLINLRPFPDYVKEANKTGEPVLHTDPIGKKEQIEEEMFLGLRKRTGVSQDQFKTKFHIDVQDVYRQQITDLVERDLLQIDGDYIRMTEHGQLFANDVFHRFLLDEDPVDGK